MIGRASGGCFCGTGRGVGDVFAGGSGVGAGGASGDFLLPFTFIANSARMATPAMAPGTGELAPVASLVAAFHIRATKRMAMMRMILIIQWVALFMLSLARGF